MYKFIQENRRGYVLSEHQAHELTKATGYERSSKTFDRGRS